MCDTIALFTQCSFVSTSSALQLHAVALSRTNHQSSEEDCGKLTESVFQNIVSNILHCSSSIQRKWQEEAKHIKSMNSINKGCHKMQIMQLCQICCSEENAQKPCYHVLSEIFKHRRGRKKTVVIQIFLFLQFFSYLILLCRNGAVARKEKKIQFVFFQPLRFPLLQQLLSLQLICTSAFLKTNVSQLDDTTINIAGHIKKKERTVIFFYEQTPKLIFDGLGKC